MKRVLKPNAAVAVADAVATAVVAVVVAADAVAVAGAAETAEIAATAAIAGSKTLPFSFAPLKGRFDSLPKGPKR